MTIPGGLREPLPPGVAACLAQLSVALHKHRAYPVDHPMRLEARESALRSFETVLKDRSILRVGVAQRQLLIDEQATDAGQPVLRELAERLHRRQIGAIVFRSGLTAEELGRAIDRLNADPRLGPVSPGADIIGPHVELTSLSYQSLAMASEGTGHQSSDEIWEELARLVLVPGTPIGSGGIELVGQAMAAQGADPQFWDAALPVMERFGRAAVGASGEGGVQARRALAALLDGLPRETLATLLGLRRGGPERIARLLSASEWLALPALLDLVEVTATESGQNVSHFLLRLLRKLGESGRAPPDGDAAADVGAREGVQALLSGWSLTDPNPSGHTRLLEQLSASPAAAGPPGAEAAAEAGRIIRMALEVAGSGAAVLDATDRLLEEGRLPELLDLLDAVPPTNEGAVAIRSRLVEPGILRQVLLEEPVDHAACGRLLRWVPLASAEGLLDSLTISEARETRWLILQRLSELGPEVAPLLVERLDAAPWYLKRNLLGVLADLPEVPAWLHGDRYAGDPEPMVRREALRVMIRAGADRDDAIHRALGDSDPQVIRVALGAAEEYGLPRASLSRLIKVLNDPSRAPELRARGVALLEQFDSPVVRQWLVECAQVRRGFFRRTRLAPKSPELLAGLAVLARRFGTHSQARHVLELAAASADPQIAEIVRRETHP